MKSFTRWPLHPPLYPHEFLSSWVRRIASAYDLDYYTFCKHVLDMNKKEALTIDNFPRKEILKELANRTGVNYAIIKQSTLYPYVGKMFRCKLKSIQALYKKELEQVKEKTFQVIAFWPWFFIEHLHHSFQRIQYCILCWQEDIVFYFRTYWQLPLITACLKHKILLADKCFNCRCLIYANKVNHLMKCRHCGVNLCLGTALGASSELLWITEKLMETFFVKKSSISNQLQASSFLTSLCKILVQIDIKPSIFPLFEPFPSYAEQARRLFRRWSEGINLAKRAMYLETASQIILGIFSLESVLNIYRKQNREYKLKCYFGEYIWTK